MREMEQFALRPADDSSTSELKATSNRYRTDMNQNKSKCGALSLALKDVARRQGSTRLSARLV